MPCSSAPISGDQFKEFEDKIDAMEARQKAEAAERQARLEYELSQMNLEDVDEELERLKRKVLD